MATKKPNKLPKKEDISLSVNYVVELPSKVLNNVLSLGCSKKLKEFGKSFSGSLEKIKKGGNLSNDVFVQFKDLVNALSATTVVLDIIEDTWLDREEKCDVKNKKLKCKKEENTKCKTAKKKTAGGILNKSEMTAIKQLRNKGFSIKAIGKTIKRDEKVVSNYVHEIEKTNRRK